MASDTRSKHGKKVQEPVVEENLVPLALEVASPIGMEALVQYLLQNNKSSEEARKLEVEEADRRQEARDLARRREAEEAEERVEKRRRQDLIDAEERQEKRDAKRLLLEKEAREEQRKHQIEDEKRAFAQQQELMRLQAEIGGKAEATRRAESDRSRKRDRAVAAIQSYRESEDVEEYLLTAEKKLTAGEVPEEEWVVILSSKLGGKIGSAWQDLLMAGGEYKDVKAGFLTQCGYTPKLAGELFFGFKQESLRGMSADQLWHRGVQLVRRVVAPAILGSDAEFALVKAWVWSVVPKRTKMMLDGRVVTSSAELIGALQDHLVSEGEKGEGQMAVFRKQHQGPEHSTGNNSERRPVGNCYRCGKPGHKVADCWQKIESGSSESAKPSAGGPAKPIICFHCGVEGHRSPQCPKKGQEKPTPKEEQGQVKPVRRLRHKGGMDIVIDGIVNGQEVPIVLDSGTAISVVPEGMVSDELLTGEVVSVMAFQSKEPVSMPTARVQFKVEHLEWEEEVALAPTVEGQEAEILCKLDVRSDRGFTLASLVREREKVLRAEAQKQAEEDNLNAEVVAKEKPKVRKPVVGTVAQAQSEAVGSDKGGRAADRPVQTPESGPPASEEPNSKIELEEEVEEEVSLTAEETDDELAFLDEEEEDVVEEELFCLKPKGRADNDLIVPPVGKGSSHRAELIEEVKVDVTLEENEKEVLCSLEEDYADVLCFEKGPPDDEEEEGEVVPEMRAELKGEVEMDIPPAKAAEHSREHLVEETGSDPSSSQWKELADERTENVEVLNEVRRLVVVTEDLEEIENVETKFLGKCLEFKDEWVEDLKEELPGVFAAGPGRIGARQLEIRTGDSPPIELGPHRVPDNLKTDVKEEIEKMLELAVPGHRATAMVEIGGPRIKRQLRAFLGSVGFCRKLIFEFVQGLAKKSSVLSPWNAKLSPSVVEWTKEGLEAVRSIKVCLINLCVLTVPSEEDVFVLHWDASGAKYRPGVEHLDADALSRQAWKSTEGDPWRPAAILQREEMEQEEADKLRAATNSQLVGGDVGTSPTGEKKKEESMKVKDCARLCKQELSRLNS